MGETVIIGELTKTPLEQRKKFWLEKLALPLEWKDVSEEQIQNPLQFLKPQGFDGLLLSEEYSEILLPKSSHLAAEIMEAGFADSLIYENGKVWLRCFLREALRLLILQKMPQLDTHATCYVTGSGMISRACAVVAIQMGYKRLVIVSAHSEQLGPFVENLQKLFFGLKVQTLGENELTLQPNNGTLLINTLTVESGGIVLEDLAYLNFLKKEGLVIDVPMSFQSNPLLDETSHIGVPSLAGIEIWGFRDFLFLQSLLKTHFKISSADYLSQWKTFLSPEKQT